MSNSYPRYRQIVDQIVSDVRTHKLSVGDTLPTEHRLMLAYGVSRHTVRKAMETLKQVGIIEVLQGKGSTVVSKPGRMSFIDRVPSIESLIDNGGTTDRLLIDKKLVHANEELAEAFACKLGREFLEMRFLRHIIKTKSIPMALLTVWIDPMFESISKLLEDEGGYTRDAIVEVMKSQYAFETTAVRQTVSACSLDTETARVLNQSESDSALKIERRYYQNSTKSPHLRSISICRSDLLTVESFYQAN